MAQEPLLLVPGLACDATIWARQLPALGEDRDIHVVDHGDAASLAEMAERALSAAPPRFALAGHSMGARVALEIIDHAPERVTRLALLDTGVHPVRPAEPASRQELLDYGHASGIEAMIDRWLPSMLHPDNVHVPTILQPLRAMSISMGLETFERQVHALLGRRDATPLLANIACPVLIGVGAQDAWSTPDQHRAFAPLIPQARLVVFDHAGHMAPFERPDLVNIAMLDWLAEPVAA